MENNSIRYSVIIPAYQAEATMSQCLTSLLTSKRSDFEVIVVDDCSTDNTQKILMKYDDCRLKILKQHKNGGVARARNLGLDVAQGAYVVFVDADDYVSERYFEILDVAVMEETDVAIFDFFVVEVNGCSFKKQTIYPKDKILSSEEIFEKMCVECSEGPWNKVYKKALIDENGLRFDVDINMWEDMLFFSKAIYCGNKIKAYGTGGYFYRITNAGLTSLSASKFVSDFIYMNQQIYRYLLYYGVTTKKLTDYSVRWLYSHLKKNEFTKEAKDVLIKSEVLECIVKGKTSNIKVWVKQRLIRWYLVKK